MVRRQGPVALLASARMAGGPGARSLRDARLAMTAHPDPQPFGLTLKSQLEGSPLTPQPAPIAACQPLQLLPVPRVQQRELLLSDVLLVDDRRLDEQERVAD